MFQINDRVEVVGIHADLASPLNLLGQTGRVVTIDDYGRMPVAVELDNGIINFAEDELAAIVADALPAPSCCGSAQTDGGTDND